MNKMQLLEYIMCRLYSNENDPLYSTEVLMRLGFTNEDIERVDKEIVEPNWPKDHTPKQSLEYCNQKIMEYEMQ